MTLKEEFMSIKTYEEYAVRREEFKKLDIHDPEVLKHYDEIFPHSDNSEFKKGIIIDVLKK